MDARVKGLWLAALRSGDYQQGRGSLRSESDQFCCLGVLCEVAAREGVIADGIADYPGADYVYAGEVALLPVEVQDWAMVVGQNPEVPFGEDPEADPVGLAALNDTGKTFTEIAGLIEQYL